MSVHTTNRSFELTAEDDGLSRCPRCALRGRLSLLTSMTRYFACDHCGWKWQHSRAEEMNEPASVLDVGVA